jgi:hypothetical protein
MNFVSLKKLLVCWVGFVISDYGQDFHLEVVDHGGHGVNNQVPIGVSGSCPSSMINYVTGEDDIRNILKVSTNS